MPRDGNSPPPYYRHVRFDERDLETEDTVSYSGTGIPKGPAHRLRLNLTPPRQISTLPALHHVQTDRTTPRSCAGVV